MGQNKLNLHKKTYYFEAAYHSAFVLTTTRPIASPAQVSYERLATNLLEELPLAFVSLVEGLELLPPALEEAGTGVRTHQRPDPVGLDSLHEEVGNPESVEQVSGALLLLAVVLAEVQELEDVGVPRLQVDGKRAWALVAALKYDVNGDL